MSLCLSVNTWTQEQFALFVLHYKVFTFLIYFQEISSELMAVVVKQISQLWNVPSFCFSYRAIAHQMARHVYVWYSKGYTIGYLSFSSRQSDKILFRHGTLWSTITPRRQYSTTWLFQIVYVNVVNQCAKVVNGSSNNQTHVQICPLLDL